MYNKHEETARVNSARIPFICYLSPLCSGIIASTIAGHYAHGYSDLASAHNSAQRSSAYVYIHAGRVPIYLYNTCIKGGCIFSLYMPVCYIHAYICVCVYVWVYGVWGGPCNGLTHLPPSARASVLYRQYTTRPTEYCTQLMLYTCIRVGTEISKL